MSLAALLPTIIDKPRYASSPASAAGAFFSFYDWRKAAFMQPLRPAALGAFWLEVGPKILNHARCLRSG